MKVNEIGNCFQFTVTVRITTRKKNTFVCVYKQTMKVFNKYTEIIYIDITQKKAIMEEKRGKKAKHF